LHDVAVLGVIVLLRKSFQAVNTIDEEWHQYEGFCILLN